MTIWLCIVLKSRGNILFSYSQTSVVICALCAVSPLTMMRNVHDNAQVFKATRKSDETIVALKKFRADTPLADIANELRTLRLVSLSLSLSVSISLSVG